LELEVYARCVGVGGFPVSLATIPSSADQYHLDMYDDRLYDVVGEFWKARIGLNGFAHLNFTGSTLGINYRSLKLDSIGHVDPTESDLLVTEYWSMEPTGDVFLVEQQVINPNMTIVQHL